MPIVDLEAPSPFRLSGRPEGFAVTPGEDDVTKGSDAPDTSIGSVALSALRQGNMVASSSAKKDWGAGLDVEPGFNPWDAIKGTKYEARWPSFTDIRSTTGADARKRQIDMEDEDRRTLSAAPWWKSLPAQLLSGAADLPSLLPGGAFVRGAGGGISVARSAAVTGVAAGAAVTGQEIGLHATQELRTGEESAMNIGTSVFLGGLLGAGGAKLLSHAEWNTAVAGLNRDLGISTKAPVAGGPLHEVVLAHPDVSEAIANPKINRTQDVPYTAGPDKTGNGLNIDRHFPEQFAVGADGNIRPVGTQEPDERVVSSAVHVDGQIFTGILHSDAFEVASKALGREVENHGEGGFLTSRGRYVSRREALKLAESAEQMPKRVRSDEASHELLAEQMPAGQLSGKRGVEGVIPHREMTDAEFAAPVKTFDPAQPFAVHEFTERHAMEKLIAGGMDQETAYKVAHWEVAEPAEGAWYEKNGIDQGKAEAAYQPFIDQIEHEKLAKGDGDVPSNLYRKPYPHDSVDAASREKAPVPKPTAEETARGREILAQGEGQASGAPASVGAAAQEPVTVEGNTIAGRAAGAVAKATAKLNPLLRLMQSPSAAVREIAGKLFENPLYLKKNFEGVASEPAVETLMKEWNGGLVKALQSTEGAWRDYRKAGGQLSKTEFREAVGRAMRRGDESEIPEVAKVAKAWRSQVFDPLKEAAIKAGLLPEDVSVDTAASYFSRMWNRNRLIAQEGKFKGIVADHYAGVIGREYDKATQGVNSRLAKLEQEIEDLNLPADERERRLGELEQALTEHDIRGGDMTEQADRLSELATEMRRAKDAGDDAARAAAKAEADAIRKAGGDDLKAFVNTRTNLRVRRRNVDLGTAGLAERQQTILENLADLEEANQRSLGRLVTKGQKLERELDKLDPEMLQERISAMRESFVALAQKADAAADRTELAIAKIKEDAAKRAERADVKEDREAFPPVPPRKGGVTLLPFIRKRGGISVDDALAGDIKGLGLGRLLSKKGIPLDRLREAAVEAGYLTDEGARGGGVSTSTINDLLDAMADETRGNKRYIPGEEPAPALDIGGRVGSGEAGRSETGARLLDAAEAKVTDRLEKHLAQQRAKAERMDKIARRLDVAEDFDREGAVAELHGAVQKAVAEVSDTSLGRGERAGRLKERLATLDPSRIKERVDTINAMKRDIERAYYDRWETKNLGKGVDPQSKERPDFTDAARDIADQVYNTLTGRTEAGVRPEFMTVGTRGPMKDRTFNIPDELVEDFLEHDIDHVGRRYARVMGADVEMAHKFGSVDMKEQLDGIRSNYNRMRSGVTDEATLAKLGKQERADVDDVTALRDLLRGTRAESPVERNFGKIARVAAHINYIRQMGEVVLASLTDAIRPAMVHGLTPYMATVGQLAKNISAIKMSVAEAQLAGNVAERVLAHRMATLTDIADPYASRGPVEAFLENMSNAASKWNGIRLWTDMMKSFTAVMTQNRILGNIDGFTKIKGRERAYMAMLGIDESMAERIAAQVAEHGEVIDGVRVAGTENWTDDVARRTYRAAVNKDMDSIIVQSGKADVPLFSHTPMGKLLLQFQSFNLASHQRVMMRGLQESPTRFIGGTIAMTSMGMLMTYLKAVSGNRTEKQEAFTSNPGWWIGEGLDRSGIIPVPMELANRFEKMTGANPIKGALKVFDKGSAESQKNQNRNDFGSMLGPTFGLGQDIMTVAGVPKTLYEGKDIAQAQKNAAVRLLPFNSYAGVRQMMNYVVNPPH